ncbi:MAG: IclR family transcriptional regulator [Frondihabitans sp.]|nr:IclR family transcriptional regulator [Frondihabitans sp.]
MGSSDNPTEAKAPLQTVSRAMRVLLSFSDTRTDWGVYELADAFGWTRSSAQRILATLAAEGFLWPDPSSRRYSLGPAVWRMSALWERTGGLARISSDVLTRLAHDTGLTALFSVPDGGFVRCVAAVVGAEGPMRSESPVGELYPAHAGATARGYFAFIDPDDRRRLLYDLPLGRFSDLTEVDEARVEALFDAAAERGHAITFGEWDSRTRAAAAPVRIGAQVVGSISIGGLNRDAEGTERPRADLERHLPRLVDAARELGDLLASRAAPPRSDWRRGRSR